MKVDAKSCIALGVFAFDDVGVYVLPSVSITKVECERNAIPCDAIVQYEECLSMCSSRYQGTSELSQVCLDHVQYWERL